MKKTIKLKAPQMSPYLRRTMAINLLNAVQGILAYETADSDLVKLAKEMQEMAVRLIR